MNDPVKWQISCHYCPEERNVRPMDGPPLRLLHNGRHLFLLLPGVKDVAADDQVHQITQVIPLLPELNSQPIHVGVVAE